MELAAAERRYARPAAPRRLRLRAAAAQHGLSVTVLKAAARAGDLPLVRTGRVLWVKEADLVAFLAQRERRVGAAGEPPVPAALTPAVTPPAAAVAKTAAV